MFITGIKMEDLVFVSSVYLNYNWILPASYQWDYLRVVSPIHKCSVAFLLVSHFQISSPVKLTNIYYITLFFCLQSFPLSSRLIHFPLC